MRLKRQLPLAVLVVSCFFVVIVSYLNLGETGTSLRTTAEEWNVVSAVFAFLLGPLNLLRLHINNVRRRRPKWIHSAFMMAVAAICTVIFFAYGNSHDVTLWIINNVANQISGAIYAMLGFYVCSAAYRTFKLKNLEATILLVAAVLLMLGQAPIGDAIWSQMSKISDWILTVPNSAGMRGIRLGTYIGSYAAVIRVILGMERSWTGGAGQ